MTVNELIQKLEMLRDLTGLGEREVRISASNDHPDDGSEAAIAEGMLRKFTAKCEPFRIVTLYLDLN